MIRYFVGVTRPNNSILSIGNKPIAMYEFLDIAINKYELYWTPDPREFDGRVPFGILEALTAWKNAKQEWANLTLVEYLEKLGFGPIDLTIRPDDQYTDLH